MILRDRLALLLLVLALSACFSGAGSRSRSRSAAGEYVRALFCSESDSAPLSAVGFVHEDVIANDPRCLDGYRGYEHQFLYSWEQQSGRCVGILLRWWRYSEAGESQVAVLVDGERRSERARFVTLQCERNRVGIRLLPWDFTGRIDLSVDMSFYHDRTGGRRVVSEAQCGLRSARRIWYSDERECYAAVRSAGTQR